MEVKSLLYSLNVYSAVYQLQQNKTGRRKVSIAILKEQWQSLYMIMTVIIYDYLYSDIYLTKQILEIIQYFRKKKKLSGPFWRIRIPKTVDQEIV